jgi:hypothetical protein
MFKILDIYQFSENFPFIMSEISDISKKDSSTLEVVRDTINQFTDLLQLIPDVGILFSTLLKATTDTDVSYVKQPYLLITAGDGIFKPLLRLFNLLQNIRC